MTAPLWKNAVLICAICSHKWVATYPDTAPSLECPGCGYGNYTPEPLPIARTE